MSKVSPVITATEPQPSEPQTKVAAEPAPDTASIAEPQINGQPATGVTAGASGASGKNDADNDGDAGTDGDAANANTQDSAPEASSSGEDVDTTALKVIPIEK